MQQKPLFLQTARGGKGLVWYKSEVCIGKRNARRLGAESQTLMNCQSGKLLGRLGEFS
jgi:hypothetical protein